MILHNFPPSQEAVRFRYSDLPHIQAQKDFMYCVPVVINLNLLCGTMAVFLKTLQLPPQPQTSPTGCTALADHQAEMGRFEPSTCSHAGYNYRPLPACLSSQPHPRMHRGSLPLASPSGCWHPLGHAVWAVVPTCGPIEGEAMCTLWNESSIM